MGTVAAIATIVSAGASIIGGIKQRKEAKRAREAQERAARIQNRQAQLQRQRNVRKALAESRVLRAQTIAGGFASGAPGSTGVQGALGGIQTDVASNIGFSNVQASLEQTRVGFLNDANAAISRGNEAAALFGGISAVSGLFTDPTRNAALFS